MATLVNAVGETRGLVAVEAWADGRLGDAVARPRLAGSAALSGDQQRAALRPADALLEHHGISRHAIVQQVLHW